MTEKNRLSRLMRISWIIQRARSTSRSRSLMAAWAIVENEDITIQHLAFKLNHNRAVSPKALSQMSIFAQ